MGVTARIEIELKSLKIEIAWKLKGEMKPSNHFDAPEEALLMYLDETSLVKHCLLGIELRSPTCFLVMMAVLQFNVYDKAFWIHRSHSEAAKSFAHGLIISTQCSISWAMAVSSPAAAVRKSCCRMYATGGKSGKQMAVVRPRPLANRKLWPARVLRLTPNPSQDDCQEQMQSEGGIPRAPLQWHAFT